MNGERSVRASARCLWSCSCGETKIDTGRAWGAHAHTLNVRAVFVLFVLSIDRRGARVCVGGGVAVDVSKAVPSNETSRHTSRMRKETVNGDTGVECIHARAPKCAVLVVCASFCLGWGGGGSKAPGICTGSLVRGLQPRYRSGAQPSTKKQRCKRERERGH